MKKTLLALVLILCLLLCSCTPAISGDHGTTPPTGEPTAAPTQPTEPPTQPTDPPATEPPVTEPTIPVPDGTPLTDDELASLQELFQWPSYYAVASHSTFSTPSELSLEMLIREGPDVEERIALTDAEKAHLSSISDGFIYKDTSRISKDAVIRALNQYYGLTLEDVPELGSLVYWEKTDCFYYCGGGTIVSLLAVTHAVTQEDGTIWVRYCDELGMERTGEVLRTGEMILKPTQDGYQILSNQAFK